MTSVAVYLLSFVILAGERDKISYLECSGHLVHFFVCLAVYSEENFNKLSYFHDRKITAFSTMQHLFQTTCHKLMIYFSKP